VSVHPACAVRPTLTVIVSLRTELSPRVSPNTSHTQVHPHACRAVILITTEKTDMRLFMGVSPPVPFFAWVLILGLTFAPAPIVNAGQPRVGPTAGTPTTAENPAERNATSATRLRKRDVAVTGSQPDSEFHGPPSETPAADSPLAGNDLAVVFVARLEPPAPQAAAVKVLGFFNLDQLDPNVVNQLATDAVSRELAYYGKSSQPSDAQAELSRLAQDADARVKFAPFLLQVCMEALQAKNPTPAQEAFYSYYKTYFAYQQLRVARGMMASWDLYKENYTLQRRRETQYGVTLGSLFEMGPSLSGYRPPAPSLGIGPAGYAAVEKIYSPMVVTLLPEFKNSPLAEEGKPMNAALAGLGFGTGSGLVLFGSMAGLSAHVASSTAAFTAAANAQLAGQGIAELAAAGSAKAAAYLASQAAAASSGAVASGAGAGAGAAGITAGSVASSLGISALIVVPLLIAGGMKIADVVKTQEFENSLRKASAAADTSINLRALINVQPIAYDAGLWYTPCRDGYRGVATLCYANCPAGYTDDGLTCRIDAVAINKEKYQRETLPLGCPDGWEADGGLCYPKCAPNERGVATRCYATCPEGFRDDGLYCAKPGTYTREGFGWQPGDPPLPNYAGPIGRCEQKYGAGNCEQWGAAIYPKCKANFHADGCCVCSPDCPPGWEDSGVSCKKPARDRGVGQPLSACPPGTERQGALCYPVCRQGFEGRLDWCVQATCPEGFRNDPLTCFKDAKVVGKESYDRGAGVANPYHPADVALSNRFALFTYLVKMTVADPAEGISYADATMTGPAYSNSNAPSLVGAPTEGTIILTPNQQAPAQPKPPAAQPTTPPAQPPVILHATPVETPPAAQPSRPPATTKPDQNPAQEAPGEKEEATPKGGKSKGKKKQEKPTNKPNQA
jgi:hypothetical protein